MMRKLRKGVFYNDDSSRIYPPGPGSGSLCAVGPWRAQTGDRHHTGIRLGDLAERLDAPLTIPYKEIPHFPVSTVSGHKGQFVCGKLGGKEVLCMQGRFHYYEGYDLKQVTMRYV